jgi:cell division protein FtsB
VTDEQIPKSQRPKKASKARERRRQGQLSGVQFLFAAILAIGMALGITLSSRIASSQPLQEFYEGVQTEIADLREEQGALLADRDYAMSDAYVEQWARDEGKMYRPGEVLVIPVPNLVQSLEVTPTPTPIMNMETTPPEPEPWMLWWALFFDSPPPEF